MELIEKDKSVLLSQPFIRFAPFFAAGMLTVYFGGELWSAGILAAAFAALIYAALRRRRRQPARFALCAVGAVCGMVLMTAYLGLYVSPITRFAGETVDAEVYVSEIVSRSGQTEEFIGKAVIDGRTAKLRLTSEQTLPEGYIADVAIELAAADLENVPENLSKGIYLVGDITEIRSSEYKGAGISGFFRTLRRGFRGKLYENVFGDSADLASAMLFGDGKKLSPEYYEYLRVSGAAHYTAVSGAHFTVLAAAVLSLLPQKRHRLRFWVSLMFAPAGLLFFGGSPSVLRASVMFFLYSLGMLLNRKTHPLNSLCVALTVIPLFSPSTILDAGFAMSVLGVLGAGVIGPELARRITSNLPKNAPAVLSSLITALCSSACAVICTAPISAALFGCVSLASVFMSLLLAPLMAAAMMFMFLLGLTGLRLFTVPVDLSMKAACLAVKTVGKCRAFVLPLDFGGARILAAALAAAVCLCAFGTPKTFMAVIKLAGVFMAVIPTVSVIVCRGRREIYFTGNANTSAAVVFDKNTASVYIAGGGDGLSAKISRVLREHGGGRVATLYAADADYGGALAIRSLAEMLPVGEVITNDLAAGLLTELPVSVPSESEPFSAFGVTFAAATASFSPDADVVLYTGRMDKVKENAAAAAVYFTKKEYDLPDNFHNARTDRGFYIKLNK